MVFFPQNIPKYTELGAHINLIENDGDPIRWNQNEIQIMCDCVNTYCILYKKSFRITPNFKKNTIKKYEMPINTNTQSEETPCKSSNTTYC